MGTGPFTGETIPHRAFLLPTTPHKLSLCSCRLSASDPLQSRTHKGGRLAGGSLQDKVWTKAGVHLWRHSEDALSTYGATARMPSCSALPIFGTWPLFADVRP